MQPLILILHVMIALAITGLVLVQHGKGADMGASFGGGSANTMFGSVGPASFLMKLTLILGLSFFVTSLVLVVLAAHDQRSNLDFLKTNPVPVSQPIAPTGLTGESTIPSLPPAGT